MNIVRLMEDFQMCPFTWRDALDDMKLGGKAAETEDVAATLAS